MELFLVCVYLFYFCYLDEDVFFVLKSFLEGKNDGVGFQAGYSYLIKQWLELVVVVFVNQIDLVVLFFEFVGKSQFVKFIVYNNDVFLVGFRYVDFYKVRFVVKKFMVLKGFIQVNVCSFFYLGY